MIKYIWMIMIALLLIYWMIYAIVDTIHVIKIFKPGHRFDHLEEVSQGAYIFIPTLIFFYSFITYLVS